MAVTKYKTKAGVRYRAFLFVKSQRVANKAGFLTKREAKQWLRKEEEKWQSPQARAKKTRMDFADLANAYLTEIEDRRKRNTYIFKRGVFRRVLNFFNNRLPLEELDRVLLAGYLRVQKDERGAKAANRDRKELSALFTWGIRHEFLYSNPAQLIEPYAEETYVRYVPSAEDIAAVRMAATKEERQFIDTLYYTAARISEIINLTWEDVNFEAKAVRLWTSKRRGGNREARLIYMHRNLEKLLSDAWNERDKESPYVFTNPYTGSKHNRSNDFIRFLFRRVCARAGVKTFTAHCIRHHVASRLADSRKATHRQIQMFLGHMNIRTTETYLHELDMDRDIVDAFDDPEEDEKIASK